MNPQEKANELVEKFLPEVRGADRYNYNLEDMNVFIAKQCALIAVDEIIKSIPLEPNCADWDDCGASHKYWYEAQKDEALEFWNEVKSELS